MDIVERLRAFPEGDGEGGLFHDAADEIERLTAAVELRRWCVEMATRWPVYENRMYGGAQQYGGAGGHSVREEADIIARAEKLLKWVSA